MPESNEVNKSGSLDVLKEVQQQTLKNAAKTVNAADINPTSINENFGKALTLQN